MESKHTQLKINELSKGMKTHHFYKIKRIKIIKYSQPKYAVCFWSNSCSQPTWYSLHRV